MSSSSGSHRVLIVLGILAVLALLIVAGLLDYYFLASPSVPAAAYAPSAPAPATITMDGLKITADRDAEIGRIVGTLLERIHYSQQPITPEMSQRWLKNYLQDLDNNHVFFLQSDIDEFTTKYSANLGDLLMHNESDEAAIAPAFAIFSRYTQRLEEKMALIKKLVAEKYDFSVQENYLLPSDKSPWPADQAASDLLWQHQVKYEILDELLKTPSTPPAGSTATGDPMEKITQRILKRYRELEEANQEKDEGNVIESYYNALSCAYDPHSAYFSPDSAANFTIQSIDLSLSGIGAVLQSDDGYAMIEQIIPGGPADLDKRLQVGDRIITVAQGQEEPVDARNKALNKVVDMIRGKKDSFVRLDIWPAGATDPSVHKEIILKRDKVVLKDSLAKAQLISHTLPDGTREKIGVIDLQEFYDNTAQDVARLIERLKQEKVASIILDMRNNGGGVLDQAVDLTGLFVRRHEPVVQIRRSDGYVEVLSADDTSPIYNGPLVVMVNKASASATEIVAGALQDYDRAIIVGDQSTHGKGTVQTLLPLQKWAPYGFSGGDPGRLKLTVQKFYRVAGGSTQQKGVISDLVLPSILDALHMGETTLPYYLPYDTIKPVAYDYLNLRTPYLVALKAASDLRVAASPDFAYLRADISRLKKKVDDKSISLNLAFRQKERDDFKAAQSKEKADLEARKNTRDPILELTLDMVDHHLPAAPPEKKPKRASLDDDNDNADNGPLDLSFDPALNETVNITTDYVQKLHEAGVADDQR